MPPNKKLYLGVIDIRLWRWFGCMSRFQRWFFAFRDVTQFSCSFSWFVFRGTDLFPLNSTNNFIQFELFLKFLFKGSSDDERTFLNQMVVFGSDITFNRLAFLAYDHLVIFSLSSSIWRRSVSKINAITDLCLKYFFYLESENKWNRHKWCALHQFISNKIA